MKSIDYSGCKTLGEAEVFTLRKFDEDYGSEYTEYLRRMPFYLKDCISYRELGTNYGSSAIMAMFCLLDYCELIDISFKNFQSLRPIFEKAAEDYITEVVYHEKSSSNVDTDVDTDFLLIDSVHTYSHVKKELAIFAPLTNKYIMFHDTNARKDVYRAVEEFLEKNSEWTRVEHYAKSAGYTVIARAN